MLGAALLFSAAGNALLWSQRSQAGTFQYGYDALGRLVTVTYPDGKLVTYTYDAAGNRTGQTTTAGSGGGGGGGMPSTIQITGTGPVNLRTLANTAGYDGVSNCTVTFEVGSGVTIMGAAGSAPSTTGGIAIDTGTWPGGYTIAITLAVKNGGKVYAGGGGGAATGASASGGGDAVYCRIPMTINVESGGEIAAGGGGGGGGGGWMIEDTGAMTGGGSGGGGFPNGPGGPTNPYMTLSGGLGSAGTTGGGGSGGSGRTFISTRTCGAGGVGGGAASAGASGAAPTGTPNFSYSNWPQGSGGGAGYAVRKNGNTVTVTNSGTIAGTQA